MNGKAVFVNAVRRMTASCQLTLDRNDLKVSDVDLVVAHQANRRILTGVAERLGIPYERFFVNIDQYGNTSSASIPIALDEAVEQRRLHGGMTVLMCAFGAGFTWASAVVQW
jgi:3-oxoacyl-[acyl-carrier-protein] synthase-3